MKIIEAPISRHESFRAEITVRDGRQVIALSRWKTTPGGVKRTGQAFEFGGHRLAVISELLGAASVATAEIVTSLEKGVLNEQVR